MPITITQMQQNELLSLPLMKAPVFRNHTVVPDALPENHVFARAKRLLEQNKPDQWALPFLIIDTELKTVVGTCGFKDEPSGNMIEIGYNVASSVQGKGIASAAIKQLTQQAKRFNSNIAIEAYILPNNLASKRVVQKSGFHYQEAITLDGDELEYWLFCANQPDST